MPPYNQHIAQAAHNECLLNFLTEQGKQVEYGDWYVTVAFYAALHYFEAVFSSKPPVGHCTDHVVRNRVIKMAFPLLHRPYSALYRISRTARYECHVPSVHNWRRAEIFLKDVKKECEKLNP